MRLWVILGRQKALAGICLVTCMGSINLESDFLVSRGELQPHNRLAKINTYYSLHYMRRLSNSSNKPKESP